jgi:hypothetical protein
MFDNGRQTAEKWQYNGRAFLFRGAIMVLTKYIKENVFPNGEAFFNANYIQMVIKIESGRI